MLEAAINASHENNATLHFDNDIQQIGTALYIICKIVIANQQGFITSKGYAEINSGNIVQANDSAKKEALCNLFPMNGIQMQTSQNAPITAPTITPEPKSNKDNTNASLPPLTKNDPNWDEIVAKARQIGDANKVYKNLSKYYVIEPAILSQLLSESGLS